MTLPPDQPVEPARHRQPLPQHRRLGAAPGLRGARRARRSTTLRARTARSTEADRPARARDRPVRARPLHGHQEPRRHRRVQDARSCATSASPAPYMHDGSMQTLWDVMDHYNKGGEANPFLDGGIEPLALTERRDRRSWSRSCSRSPTSASPTRTAHELARQQRARAQTQRPFRDDALAMRKVLPFERARHGEARRDAERGRPCDDAAGVKSIETSTLRGARRALPRAARSSTAAPS